MSSGSARWTRPKLEPVAPGARVTWLELFYDLVFAFAFIRVTLTAERSPGSLLRALLLVSLLWFLWTTFTTLGNFARGDEGVMPFACLIAVGATFIAALVLPYADGHHAHPSDYVFACCFIVVRALWVLVFWERVRRVPGLRPRWRVVIGPPAASAILLLAAATVPYVLTSHLFPARVVLLALAVVVAYTAGTIFAFHELGRIATRHWTDRYAQIILIALGESVIAVGTAREPSENLVLTWPLLAGAAFGLSVISAIAFNYFDHHMADGEHALRATHGSRQTALARDAYILLHLPMIIGILLFSLGLDQVYTDIRNPVTPAAGHPSLDSVSLLYGGVFLYGVASLGFQRRTGQRLGWLEVAVRPPLLLAIPAVALLPAMYAVFLLAVYMVGITTLRTVSTIPQRMRSRAVTRQRERRVEAAAEAHERAVQAAEADQPADPTGANVPGRGHRG
ncbi:MAG: low temperature requirement protein A [Micromonosporaceae bacterium]|nr:low temperature requirement protein A [Micromonosporaceae bacterium]